MKAGMRARDIEPKSQSAIQLQLSRIEEQIEELRLVGGRLEQAYFRVIAPKAVKEVDKEGVPVQPGAPFTLSVDFRLRGVEESLLVLLNHLRELGEGFDAAV